MLLETSYIKLSEVYVLLKPSNILGIIIILEYQDKKYNGSVALGPWGDVEHKKRDVDHENVYMKVSE